MEPTQAQINAYVAALITAGIDPAAFGLFMARSKLFIELRELETAVDVLNRQRAETMSAYDAQENTLRSQIAAKRAEIEANAG